jgi:hypothetical protein
MSTLVSFIERAADLLSGVDGLHWKQLLASSWMLSFYERAFGARTRMLHEGKDYGELSTGGTTLAFSSRTLLRRLGKSPEPPVPGRPTFELAFATTDVEDPLSSSMRCWRKTYSGTASRKLGADNRVRL